MQMWGPIERDCLQAGILSLCVKAVLESQGTRQIDPGAPKLFSLGYSCQPEASLACLRGL